MAFDWTPYLQNQSNPWDSGYETGLPQASSTSQRLPEEFFFNYDRDAIETFGHGPNFMSPKQAPAGLSARDVVGKILEQGDGKLLELLIDKGYFNQFPDWPDIAQQVGGLVTNQQLPGLSSSDDAFSSLFSGAAVHGGNILQNYLDNPEQLLTAGAFGPAGSSLESDLWGTDNPPSNVWGQPSDATYQEQAARGIDTGATSWMNDMGRMIGMSAAGAGLANAAGLGPGNVPAEAPAPTQAPSIWDNALAQGGNTMTDVPLTGGPDPVAPAGTSPAPTPPTDWETLLKTLGVGAGTTFAGDALSGDPSATSQPDPNNPYGDTSWPDDSVPPSGTPRPTVPITSNFTPTSAPTDPRTGAPLPGAGSPLSNLLGGTGSDADWLSVLGTAGGTALGVYGANQQSDAMRDIANKEDARIREMMGFGAPYRGRLSELYANPNAFMTSPEVTIPVQQGTDALARALSVRGNPAGSGAALHELQNYASNQLFGRLGQEKDRLAGYGGLTAYAGGAARGPDLNPSMGAVNAQGGIYDSLGYGLGALTQPRRRSLADYMSLT